MPHEVGDNGFATVPLHIGPMRGLTFAWSDTPEERRTPRAIAGGVAVLVLLPVALWVLIYGLGLFTTLGYAEGSERHGSSAIRVTDETTLGMPAIYLLKGQKAWWQYDVTVEGDSGVRLRITKMPPDAGFSVRVQDVRVTGSGRFEIVAPAAGFYSFSHELVPLGILVGPARPGATRYALTWGAE